jgi:two-component system, LytTR family, sensor kinase
MPKVDGGHVQVTVQNGTPGRLKIIVEDNGLGINATRAEKTQNLLHNSLGMDLTKDRLELLQQLYRRTFTSEVMELKDKEGKVAGTRVTLVFDYEH